MHVDSHYKHHNTVKFLIGITPQGVISFVSKGWEGHVSDKLLTESCEILGHLLLGDQILADGGFNVQEIVGLYCAKIKNSDQVLFVLLCVIVANLLFLLNNLIDTCILLYRLNIYVNVIIISTSHPLKYKNKSAWKLI